MASARRALTQLSAELGAVENGLDQALELVADGHWLYERVLNHVKRQLNQAVFERILVEDGEVPTARLTPAFGEGLTLVDRTTTEVVGRDSIGASAIGKENELDPPAPLPSCGSEAELEHA